MPTKKEKQKLVETKKALAAKYLRLAQLSKSKPKAATLHLHAEDYRRQAENLSNQL